MPTRFAMRQVALLAAALVAALAANAATPPAKRPPPPAGTPSPLNAHRNRPTPLSTSPPRGATVPAYGVNLDPINGNAFVFLDAANPGELTLIAPTARTLVGGAFIDNDFSRFYVIDADTDELYWLDTSDGSEHLVGPTLFGGGGVDWTGLATDPNSGILYGTTTDLTGNNPVSTLYAIDRSTGFAKLVGSFGPGRVVDIAVGENPSASPRGTQSPFFAIDTFFDTIVGVGGTIGSLGFDAEYASLIDFNGSNGVLYLAAIDNVLPTFQPDQMYTVDTTTGAAMLVGGISADPAAAELSAFAIAEPAGICAVAEDIPWIGETPTADTDTPGASTLVTMTFDASALTPGTYSAYLCFSSNDPGNPAPHVPVTLTVQ
jgi:hypothetical protein